MTDNKESQVYELSYLLLPSIAEDNLPQVVEKMSAIVTDAGAKVFDSETPFKQDLAYTMSKVVGASRYVVNDAYIGWMKFDISPEAVNDIKAKLEKMDELLRFLLVKAPRETTFTFAKAKAALAEKAAEEKEQREEVEEPAVVE